MIENGLFSYLSSVSGITAIVGTRIFAVRLPQQPTFPSIVYSRITGSRVQKHGGRSGLAHPRFQIDAWADSPLTAKQLAEQIRLALEGYSGAMGSETAQAVLFIGDSDDYEPETGKFRVISEYEIWHGES